MDYNRLLLVSTEVGYRLLESGAEIYRVEESISRIIAAYGVKTGEVFAIPTFMVVTLLDGEGRAVTVTRRIPSRVTNLRRVHLLNRLCRKICSERPSFDEIDGALDAIREEKGNGPSLLLFAGALVGAGFTLFYGGTPSDVLCGALCGLLIKLIVQHTTRLGANLFFQNIMASAAAAVLAFLSTSLAAALGAAGHSDVVIIGSLMNLVPGVAITYFMRDIIAGDLLSGLVKLTEAFLAATGIALGAGITLFIAHL